MDAKWTPKNKWMPKRTQIWNSVRKPRRDNFFLYTFFWPLFQTRCSTTIYASGLCIIIPFVWLFIHFLHTYTRTVWICKYTAAKVHVNMFLSLPKTPRRGRTRTLRIGRKDGCTGWKFMCVQSSNIPQWTTVNAILQLLLKSSRPL